MADDDLFQQGISSGINFDKFDKIPVCTRFTFYNLNSFGQESSSKFHGILFKFVDIPV